RGGGPWEWTSLEVAAPGYVLWRRGMGEPLTAVEPDGTIVGLLAESWTMDADQLTWRFRIRSGVTFHDGSPVTASAVVASLDKSRGDAETLSGLPIAAISAEGDSVVIRTKEPFGPLPAFLTDWG